MTTLIKVRSRWKHGIKEFRKQIDLQIFVLPGLIFVFVFMIAPLFGLQIAFKDYTFRDGIIGSDWVGLKHFVDLFNDPWIGGVIYNTIMISLLKMVFMFPLPIIFALMLNELRFLKFKKMIQTISYFPYFIAWIVVAYMATVWLSPTSGFINGFLVSAGILKEPYFFLGKPEAFWGISVVLDIWKNLGYASIIFLAALSAMDQEVIEASVIDGAGRFRRMWHVMLPAIRPVIVIILILNMGFLFQGGMSNSNFQLSFALGNPLNHPRSEILDTYVLRTGINMFRYSYATAVSLISSVVSAILLFSSNFISKKVTGEGYF